MKTLKVLLQEVVSGIKAWVNSNFAQESNTVHKTGNETVNGNKTFTGQGIFNVSGDTPVKLVNSQDATNPGSTVMKDLRFYDVNDKIIGGVRHSLVPDGTSKIHLYSRSFSSDGNSNSNHGLLVVNNRQTGVHEVRSESSFIPAASNSYNLGTSAYQWNNAFAKTYYAEGVKIKSLSQEVGVIPSNSDVQTIEFRDKNDLQHGYIGLWDYSAGASEIQFNITDKFKDGAKDPTGTASSAFLSFGFKSNSDHFITFSGKVDNSIIPLSNNLYNLGSSTNQWWTISSRYYYYNGVAWGLDKNNTWTGEQTYSTGHYAQSIWLKSYELDFSVNGNTGLTQTNQNMIHWVDKNNAVYSSIQSWTASSENTLVLRSKYRTDANTVRDLSVRFTSTATNKVIYPETNADTDLGISTNKWKSFNSINPGALSIPDGIDSSANSSFTPDTTNWPKDGTAFQAEMPIVGWLRISIKNVAGNYAFVRRGLAGANLPWQIFADPTFATDFAEVTLNVPVTNGTYTLRINSPGGFIAKIFPCLGNV